MRLPHPFKLAASTTLLALGLAAAPAHAGKTLDAVKARGTVKCGVTNGVAGFSAPDTQGNWTGLDVDTRMSAYPPGTFVKPADLFVDGVNVVPEPAGLAAGVVCLLALGRRRRV